MDPRTTPFLAGIGAKVNPMAGIAAIAAIGLALTATPAAATPAAATPATATPATATEASAEPDSPTEAADTDERLAFRATLVDPFSPFVEVRIEATRFGRAPALALERTHPASMGSERRMVLLDGDQLAGMVLRLQQCIESEPIGDRSGERADAPLRRAFIEAAGSIEAVELAEPALGPEGVNRCMSVLREALAPFEGLVSYAPDFWGDADFGWLSVNGPDAHRVLVNGRDLGLRTPVRRVQLETGRHRISLLGANADILEEIEVQVQPQYTTVVHIGRE
ncbi:MAG: hypothetical protein EA398_13685 [Deltaproteobacteria bacterium]|nr:MAG: hypothetical protein EA398_13685 [Deltaproteobacteria bacterium]